MSLPPYLFFFNLSAVSGFPFTADTSSIAQGVPSLFIFFYYNELSFSAGFIWPVSGCFIRFVQCHFETDGFVDGYFVSF